MISLRVSSDIEVTIDQEYRISSYVTCKSLNVWSVYFIFDTLSCQNYFFQGVWGVYRIVVEILEGWGVISVVKNWKFQGGGGLT